MNMIWFVLGTDCSVVLFSHNREFVFFFFFLQQIRGWFSKQFASMQYVYNSVKLNTFRVFLHNVFHLASLLEIPVMNSTGLSWSELLVYWFSCWLKITVILLKTIICRVQSYSNCKPVSLFIFCTSWVAPRKSEYICSNSQLLQGNSSSAVAGITQQVIYLF